jgi:hypothetical protein
MPGPCFRIADVLTTLGTGEFQVGHKILAARKRVNGRSFEGTPGTGVFTALRPTHVKPSDCQLHLTRRKSDLRNPALALQIVQQRRVAVFTL